ncbi:APC family permease [Methanococcoides burtonii]|uniref:Amino acid/polyamine transporter I n=1 Tax=Methanococcoides burtonii (strain DSM 6242 / NBRC 107633 / OCM 468 / ACE-M) TaxID=259564 RepID=Q12ZN6_METBU|nr:APC family permease [Methanococcoides burtonii]ABE51090.1 Amino acid/polyamine transporter I [Methanococcoides burtonii DSM 6242]
MNDVSSEKSIGYLSAVSIGIGGMVGGGIFAVLGLAVEIGKGGTPIAFGLAGIVALITSYSYAKLSVRYPSEGGTVEFLNQAFGSGLVTGGLNILLWLSYVVMLSLYAYAFGSYGSTFFPDSMQAVLRHVLTSIIIVSLTVVNIVGAKVVGKLETWIVGFKVAILLIFIGVGIWSVKSQPFQPTISSNPLQLVAGGMIIFLAYEGFELIANTAKDVKNPGKTLPCAYYSAVVFVIVLYVLIAFITVETVSIDSIIQAKDYALAVAAKPFLGNFGFNLIAVAALLSTASAINATLYGASRVSFTIAKDGELPEILEEKIWNRPIEGLLITSALTLIVANTFNLASISIMGSAGFLLIFGAVNASNACLYQKTASYRWISITGIIVCSIALFTLIWYTLNNSPKDIFILAFMLCSAFAIEAIYRRFTGRYIKKIHE